MAHETQKFSPYEEHRVIANVPGATCIYPWQKQLIVGV